MKGMYDVECFKDLGMIYTEAGQATRRVIIMLRAEASA